MRPCVLEALLLPQPSPPIPAKAHPPAQIPPSFRPILDFLALRRLTSPCTPLQLPQPCLPRPAEQLHQDWRNIRHIAETPHTWLWYDGLSHNTFVWFLFRFLPHTKHYPICFLDVLLDCINVQSITVQNQMPAYLAADWSQHSNIQRDCLCQ